jgi:hypothetical protein
VKAVTPTTAAPRPQPHGAATNRVANAAPPGRGGSDPPPPVPNTTAGPGGKPPLKVAVVGDSMADGLGYGLQRWADEQGDVVVYDLATWGCPISRGGTRRFPDGTNLWEIDPGCSWWADASSDRTHALVQFNPDIIVIEDGLNEAADRRLPSWSNWRHTGQPEFDSWLVDEYTAAFNTFTGNRAKLIFLNAPCADWLQMDGVWAEYQDNSDGDTRIASLNRTTQALSVTGASLGDLNAHLCPSGKFTNTVDGVSNARPDGYHLSDAAAVAVARKWLGPLVLSNRPTRAPL